MPTQNSLFGPQKARRASVVLAVCAFTFLPIVGSAHAANWTEQGAKALRYASALIVAGSSKPAFGPEVQTQRGQQPATPKTNDSGTSPATDSSSDDLFSWIFSTYGISIILVLLLVSLLVFKKVQRARAAKELAAKSLARSQSENTQLVSARKMPEDPHPNDALGRSSQPTQHGEKPTVDYEFSAYGAYRVDQEVGKLILGNPHRMDVMASRAADDRRAIEASLIKALDSSDAGDDGRRRAREALEEYGFVARQSAMLLLGRDAWERSSAARTLAQIGSQTSLSFLIEALHDGDPVVRNQAVASLGALKLPAAIGALLDIARRHPDIPASLLSETLSACSVESLGYLDSSSEPALLADGTLSADVPGLESFVAFEDLPAGNEDVELTETLAQLENADEGARTQIVRQLGSHHVQRSVSALSAIALSDSDPAVRAAAVSSLGSIDHESVFAPVLLALADESREVCAAAARTLTSFHFDRADAYVRVVETADEQTLRDVARACISTGIVAQAVDRLASEDRRQAYEAFSLFTLIARANEIQPILDAIYNHNDNEVRLCAVRVLNVAAQPDVAPKLRELASSEGMPENVRTAILEVLYKLDQEQPVCD